MYFDAVLTHDGKPLFNGTPEEVRDWLTGHGTDVSPTYMVYLGRANRTVPVPEYLVYLAYLAQKEKKMDQEAFLDKARRLVKEFYNANAVGTDRAQLVDKDVYVVWFCKTLQNWKALVSTEVPDNTYYEVTYNGDDEVTYFDMYVKHVNLAVHDGESTEQAVRNLFG